MPPASTTPRALVRSRPGMYIGDTSDTTGLHQLLWEVLANSLDEHLAGHCHHIRVTLHADDSVEVVDDGRGIAPERLRRLCTTLHTTGTADAHTPHVHVGRGGAGLAVVNFLSAWFELEVHHGGARWTQRFGRGRPVTRLCRLGPTRRTGTRVRLLPDPSIFHTTELLHDHIKARLSELAALGPGLVLDLHDLRRRRSRLASTDGLLDLLHARLRHHDPPPPSLRLRDRTPTVALDVAIAFTAPHHRIDITSFVNLQPTPGGGSHVRALLKGLRRALPNRPRDAGLTAAIHVILHHARFINPTQDTLDEPTLERALTTTITRLLRTELTRTPALRRALGA